MMANVKTTQIIMSKIETEQLKTMLRLLQEALTGKQEQPQQLDSKKRVYSQIAGGHPLDAKVRKENTEAEKSIIKQPVKRLSLSDLPWDTVNIIINFSQHSDYRLFRLNKTFTRLINKRRRGITFKLAEISSTNFFSLLRQTDQQIHFLKIATTLKFIKKTSFEDSSLRFKTLRELDLSKLELISELAMTKIFMSASETLKTFRVTVRN